VTVLFRGLLGITRRGSDLLRRCSGASWRTRSRRRRSRRDRPGDHQTSATSRPQEAGELASYRRGDDRAHVLVQESWWNREERRTWAVRSGRGSREGRRLSGSDARPMLGRLIAMPLRRADHGGGRCRPGDIAAVLALADRALRRHEPGEAHERARTRKRRQSNTSAARHNHRSSSRLDRRRGAPPAPRTVAGCTTPRGRSRPPRARPREAGPSRGMRVGRPQRRFVKVSVARKRRCRSVHGEPPRQITLWRSRKPDSRLRAR